MTTVSCTLSVKERQNESLRSNDGGMKRAHQAAAHDTWFREQVQASIDDPRPSVDDQAAKKEFAAKRAALAKRTGAAKKAAH